MSGPLGRGYRKGYSPACFGTRSVLFFALKCVPQFYLREAQPRREGLECYISGGDFYFQKLESVVAGF